MLPTARSPQDAWLQAVAFHSANSSFESYQALIELGNNPPSLFWEGETMLKIVRKVQNLVYMDAFFFDPHLSFEAKEAIHKASVERQAPPSDETTTVTPSRPRPPVRRKLTYGDDEEVTPPPASQPIELKCSEDLFADLSKLPEAEFLSLFIDDVPVRERPDPSTLPATETTTTTTTLSPPVRRKLTFFAEEEEALLSASRPSTPPSETLRGIADKKEEAPKSDPM